MIHRTAADPSNMAWKWRFTVSAREAWRSILTSLPLSAGQSILLPAYIGITDREGSGLFDPVRSTKTASAFYSLGTRLEIEMGPLEAMLRTGKHPALLAAHYFGLPHASMDQLRRLCDAYDVLLIEDCAHVPGPLAQGATLGAWGHASFFSLHKMLPVAMGGALCINSPWPSLEDAEAPACPTPSLEGLVRADWIAIRERRRRNYNWLAQRLVDTDGIEILFPDIGAHTPHDFPIWVHDGLRERLYFMLMERSMPTVALYYRLIPEIDADAHPNSHALSRSILNLPVHQDTTLEDLTELCDALEQCLLTLRGPAH